MSDLILARRSRDAYAPNPAGKVFDWKDMRAVLSDDGVLAIRGTASYANAMRDMRIAGETSTVHPQLGSCPAGPLEAALALAPLVGTPATVTGHSLGGQCAILVSAVLTLNGTPPASTVTFDAPKAGDFDLVTVLLTATIRQYRFRGSVVTRWPIDRYLHMRRLVDVGAFVFNVIEAHSIERACQWMEIVNGPWS